MIRLQLLGSLDLRDEDGRELRAVLAQPKRLALLAYLAAASPFGPHRRDTLLGIFWPGLDQEHARNALSKAIHFLRRALGERAIASRTAEELAVAPEVVWTDVRAFAEALDAGRTDEALELYRGDLLPSFFVSEAPGFEEWLEGERARFRVRAAAAARILAERHEARRHLTLAVACARRAVELSGGDERPLRRLIELLDRAGDRAGAVRAYEDFARKLATELEVEPAPETVALIERIRSSRVSQPGPARVVPPGEASQPPLARLAAALADRYKIDRELGAGAMAVVALAHDLRHHRRVAIKVLRPELASLMGPERFLREIDIAAGLMHPHILPLHDSGEANGLLYYVMPYVEGESLRGRLERERRLPLEDAVQIAREVGDALGYAHRRGFVHRDIKPENILLGGGHALVADFGIARAIGSVAPERISAQMLGTGTPAYMSPEQATRERQVDERTDIYALGCVLYEMLAGEPPFAGPTPEATVERRLSGSAPRLSATRPEVSSTLDAILVKALARRPEDRFRTVGEFTAALPLPAPGASAKAGATGRPRALAAAALVGMVALTSIAFWPAGRDRSGSAVNPRLVAVLPFRVAGGDSALAALDEGMVDLLATRLSAGADVRVVESSTALAAWRRAVPADLPEVTSETVLAVAERLGAGRAITGSVVGAVGKVTLTASLYGVPEGVVRSRASVTGRPDSLMALVDWLTAQLLSVDAGEAEHRLAGLTSTSLPALREYLEGQAAMRRFQFDRAREHYAEAVRLDSTFALAAFSLSLSLKYGFTRIPAEVIERAERLMWTFSGRLSEQDRLRLRAQFPADHPRWTPPARQIAFVDSVLTVVPDDPVLWHTLGVLLFAGGNHLAIPHWRERATTLFRRAVALDSMFLEPRERLALLATDSRDTASLLDQRRHYARHAPPEASEVLRWRAAVVTGEDAGEFPGRELPTFSEQSLRRIVMESPSYGLRLDHAEEALRILLQRAASGAERERTLLLVREFALNRGRPAESLRAMREVLETNQDPAFQQERLRELVYHALYWDADQAAAAEAARRLARVVQRPAAAETDAWAEQLGNRCVLEQWRLAHQDRSTVRETIAILKTANLSREWPRTAARARACAALLEALLASADNQPDVPTALARLDSLHMAGLPDLGNEAVWFCAGNLVSARLRAAHGDVAGALAAVRRRGEPGDQKILLSSYLREEGRLALLAGDTTGALRAYRHFLVLRSDPESHLLPEVRRLRAQIERLGS